MNDSAASPDTEFEAMRTIYSALEPLDDDARARVIGYIISRLEVIIDAKTEAEPAAVAAGQDGALQEEQSQAPKYRSFAELYDAAQPITNANKALIAGYWLQVCQGQEDFDAQSANKELKHLGQGVANITIAANNLREQKPALLIQLRKSGRSQQSRKTYKVTVAGIKATESMITARS
jgi:hypothetical protein